MSMPIPSAGKKFRAPVFSLFIFFVVMALVIAGVLTNLWMRPLMALTYGLLEIVLMPLAMLVQ